MEDSLSVYLLIGLLAVLIFQLYDIIITSVKLQIAYVVSSFKFLYLRRYLSLYLLQTLPSLSLINIFPQFMKTPRDFISLCQPLAKFFASLSSLCMFIVGNRYQMPVISMVYLRFVLNASTAPRYSLIFLLA